MVVGNPPRPSCLRHVPHQGFSPMEKHWPQRTCVAIYTSVQYSVVERFDVDLRCLCGLRRFSFSQITRRDGNGNRSKIGTETWGLAHG
jgi:hypothetical protein